MTCEPSINLTLKDKTYWNPLLKTFRIKSMLSSVGIDEFHEDFDFDNLDLLRAVVYQRIVNNCLLTCYEF